MAIATLRSSATVERSPTPARKPSRLLGESMPMRRLHTQLGRVGPTDATVLIQGETGTGKELVARALHDRSARAGGPFVVVDCGALPESLLDAELFGHNRGAFTGAVAARTGAFEAADGGTLFLDEIGELPLPMQPRLLRALEQRAVRRLGQNDFRPVDVRFVSATHRDLLGMVKAGTFREDLYFRLAVLCVTIPPLRERSADVVLLAEHFLSPDHRPLLTRELEAELAARVWPGNVRELRSFVERLKAVGATDALAMSTEARPPADPAAAGAVTMSEELLDLSFSEARDRGFAALERQYVEALLARHGRKISAAARAAGIQRTYLHRLVRKHGL